MEFTSNNGQIILLLFTIFTLFYLFNINKNKRNEIIKNYGYLIIILLVVLISSFFIKIRESFDTIFSEWDDVDKTGTTDVTQKLVDILSKGGDITIPDGDYLINSPIGRGVMILITTYTNIICSPNTNFIAGPNLDDDMISFNKLDGPLPTITSDTPPRIVTPQPLPSLTLNWKGGTFYQNNQKTINVLKNDKISFISYPVNYKAKYTGNSNKINGALTIYSFTNFPLSDSTSRGFGAFYNNSYGISNCSIDSVTCYGAGNKTPEYNNININESSHWENAGGGNGISIEGVKTILITNCKLIGNRHTGIYISGNTYKKGRFIKINDTTYDYTTYDSDRISSSNIQSKVSIKNNTLINCFTGITITKDGINNLATDTNINGEGIVNNTFINNPIGIHSNNSSNVTLNIKNNTGMRSNIFVKVESKFQGISANVENNNFNELGALLSDNKTICLEPNVTYGFQFINSFLIRLYDNSVTSMTQGLENTPSLNSTIKLVNLLNIFKGELINNKYDGLIGGLGAQVDNYCNNPSIVIFNSRAKRDEYIRLVRESKCNEFVP